MSNHGIQPSLAVEDGALPVVDALAGEPRRAVLKARLRAVSVYTYVCIYIYRVYDEWVQGVCEVVSGIFIAQLRYS